MENRSSKREPRPILNSLRLRRAFCFAQTWPREVSTFQMLIGLFNMIHQMTLTITFIELAELPEGQVDPEELFYSYMSMSLDSCDTSNRKR